MTDLRAALEECRTRIARHRKSGQRIGEQNTKVMLIEPVLAALGWDLFDPEEVNREYRRRSADNPVDYALLLMRTPRLFVEAKGLGENINDPRWANQIISYAAVAGVEWVALTDGAEWQIYNAHAPVPVEEKLFRSVKVDTEGSETLDTLSLLSTDNMKENRIQELWRGYFIDRQVHQVLVELFAGTEPPAELVNLVARRAEQLSKTDVRASLIRARATFDWPTPEIAPPVPYVRLGTQSSHPAPPAPYPALPATAVRPTAGAKRPKVTAAERSIKLTDLLAYGRVRPGEIIARYDGQEWRARIDEGGAVSFDGRPQRSLSEAGKAVKIASRGPDTPESVYATDGWEFWRAHDQVSGDVVALKEIRRRAAQDRGLIDS
ncbi:restriction system modified-DNA reader domain-containing protein [Georgenia yuyongxinii]